MLIKSFILLKVLLSISHWKLPASLKDSSKQTSVIFIDYWTINEFINCLYFTDEEIGAQKLSPGSRPHKLLCQDQGRDETEPLFPKSWPGLCPPNPVLISCCPFWVPRSVSKFTEGELQSSRATEQQVRDTRGDRTQGLEALLPENWVLKGQCSQSLFLLSSFLQNRIKGVYRRPIPYSNFWIFLM